jgi:hypothetical protein
MAGVLALKCYPCYLGRAPAPAAERRSRRLAAKPAVSYYEAPIPSEATIRRRDQHRAEAAMVRNARRVQRRAEAAVAQDTQRKLVQVERILREIERSVANSAEQSERQNAEILSAMPAVDATWAPPRDSRSRSAAAFAPQPALSRTEATGCALPELDLCPPTPLRRTCQLPSCDDWCTYCRENDRIAAANSNWNPLAEPRPAFLPPPPIGATVVRVPIDLSTLTRAALQQIIVAATSALASKP